MSKTVLRNGKEVSMRYLNHLEERGPAVLFAEQPNAQMVFRRILECLQEVLNKETRDVAEEFYAQKPQSFIAHDIADMEPDYFQIGRACFYLLMCRLVEQYTFIGNYYYRITQAGIDALESTSEISFNFDPDIFSEADLTAWRAELKRRKEFMEYLHADDVENGTIEYWDRWWAYEANNNTIPEPKEVAQNE